MIVLRRVKIREANRSNSVPWTPVFWRHSIAATPVERLWNVVSNY